jgi:hypothetical protein
MKILARFAAPLFGVLFMVILGFSSCSQGNGDDSPSGPVLLSLEVTNPPDKIYYEKNESFKPAGMVVTGTYDNGGSREVTDYAVSPVDTTTIGEKTVTVSLGRVQTNFPVFVNEYPLQDIVVTSPPAKLDYAKGEEFDPEGLVVEGVYVDGQREVSGYTHNFDSSVEGTFTVTLTLNGFTADFQVAIGPAALLSIAVTTPPAQTLYGKEETFKPAGMVVTGSYTDGTTKTESGYAFSGNGTGTLGEKTVTVILEKEGKTFAATFSIVVSDSRLMSINVKRNPDKQVYLWHEELDPAGLMVEGVFSDLPNPVTVYPDPGAITGYDKTLLGEQTVMVTVQGQSASFTVTVKTPKLYFDHGRRITDVDPPVPGTYTVPQGRTLVLAPVRNGVGEAAPYIWKVNNVAQSATGEYFSFYGVSSGSTAMVTVSLAGLPETEITTYIQTTDSEGTWKRPKTGSSKPWSLNGFEFTQAPGQFVGSHATEEAVLRVLRTQLQNDTFFSSLGSFGGYVIMGFDHSVENISGQYSLAIEGNAFGSWVEPGVVWVSQDDNGNGLPDDTWYELAGSETGKSETIQCYSITWHKPVGASGPKWEDNLGDSGQLPDQTYYGTGQGYPSWLPGTSFTFTGTRLTYYGSFIWGYVDCTTGPYFRISDAIQQDGSPIHLQYIDFVKVQCAINSYAGIFGEISTETSAAYDTSMDNPRLQITGLDIGGGQYTYQFINTSGYDVTLVVEGTTYYLRRSNATGSIGIGGGPVTLTLTTPTTYYAYWGGNIGARREEGKVTFFM